MLSDQKICYGSVDDALFRKIETPSHSDTGAILNNVALVSIVDISAMNVSKSSVNSVAATLMWAVLRYFGFVLEVCRIRCRSTKTRNVAGRRKSRSSVLWRFVASEWSFASVNSGAMHPHVCHEQSDNVGVAGVQFEQHCRDGQHIRHARPKVEEDEIYASASIVSTLICGSYLSLRLQSWFTNTA